MKPNTTGAGQCYEVGYGKPPKAGRFRKGQSGNPKGRKPSEENFLSIFRRLATRRIKANIDGAPRTLTLAEAIIAKNYQAALQGDQIAMGNILKLVDLAGEFQDWSDPKVMGRPIFMPERSKSIEEFLAESGAGVVKIGGLQTDD